MSNKGPIIWSKNKAKMLNKGPLEFSNGVLFEVVDGAPTGARPKGTVVIDTDAKLWQATDGGGNYQQFATNVSSINFDTDQFTGDGSGGNPITLTGEFDDVTISGDLLLNSIDSKATPLDADTFLIKNTEAANVIDEVSGTNLKAYLKTYFDSIYQPLGGDVEYSNLPLSGSTTLAPAATSTIITYTVPTGKKFRLLSGSGSSDGNIIFEIKIDGTTYVMKRSSYQLRDVDLTLPIELVAAQVLTVVITNDTIESENNFGSAYLHGKEFTA